MTLPPPNPHAALSADEVQAAGLDPGLRDLGLTPIQRLVELVGDYDPGNTVEFADLAEIGTVCLIEQNERNGDMWLTLFASPTDAVNYHYGQEYAGDWDIVVLVDLATGIAYEPTHGFKEAT
jgi:hypothetical protein